MMWRMGHARLRVVNMVEPDEGARLNRAPLALRKNRYAMNPCAHCPGHCCALSVLLSTVEAQRIALTLAIPLGEVVVTRSPLDEFTPSMTDPPVIPLDTGDQFLQLKRSLSTKSCVFMLGINGQGRCGIYGLRPHVCALFPFHLSDGESLFKVGNQNHCPVKWMRTDGLEEDASARHAMFLEDRAHERELVESWRAHDGADRSFEAYAAFSQRFVVEKLGFPAPEEVPPLVRRSLSRALW